MAHLLTVAGVFAHPDDETWAMGGAFAMLVRAGVRCVVWTATRGQAGEIAAGSNATRDTLPRVREAEERAAMRVVGVERVEFGDFRDGEVVAAGPAVLIAAVGSFLDRELPDVVVTMEPGGVTAHPDHMAVSRAVQAAFVAYAARGRERRPRLYYWGVPESGLDRYRELGRAAGIQLPGENDPYGPRGTPDEQFTCRVETAPVAELTWRALQEHRTQAGDPSWTLLGHADQWREVFSRAAYIRVRPVPSAGDPPESSLVEAYAGDGQAVTEASRAGGSG